MGIPWEGWVGAASGLLLLLLGGFVATRRPRRRVNLAFGTFAAAFGVPFALTNLTSPLAVSAPVWVNLTATGLWILAAVALVVTARDVPAGVKAPKAATWIPSLTWAFTIAALFVAFQDPRFVSGHVDTVFVRVSHLASFSLTATVWAVLLLLALRYRDAVQKGVHREVVLLSLGLAAYPAMWCGRTLISMAHQQASFPLVVAFVIPLLLWSTLWLINTTRGRGSREAGLVVLLGLGLPLLGAVSEAAGAALSLSMGIARTIGVVVLAYAVVRYQVLGIDMRIRWTISKSTLAAAFFGVFFVASEITAVILGDAAGSQYVGIAAAGALMFVLAPLQRAADRIAERAVPDTGRESAWETYRQAVRVAMADGAMTPDEELLLARLQKELGLDPEEAVNARHEVVEAMGTNGPHA